MGCNDMILGIITATFFIGECLLAILSRARKNSMLIKLHCIGGYITLVFALIHFLTVLKLWHQRPVIMNVSGCIMLICIALICILFLIRKNKPTIHKILAVVITIMLSIHIYSGVSSLHDYQTAVSAIEIDNINISAISDGIYEGECNVGYIYAHVSVTVQSGRIVNIDILEHRNERGSLAEGIIDDIIAQQKIDVDAVTSATNSSKVIKKAVENALINAS